MPDYPVADHPFVVVQIAHAAAVVDLVKADNLHQEGAEPGRAVKREGGQRVIQASFVDIRRSGLALYSG